MHTVNVQTAYRNFASCSHNQIVSEEPPTNVNNSVCTTCIAELEKSSKRSCEYVSFLSQFGIALADCAMYGNELHLSNIAAAVVDVVNDEMVSRNNFF